MIRLSKLSDYAIVVLSCLAAEHGQLQTAAVLSQQTRIPEPTVAKVLKLLSKKEIVNSVRGVRGGYSLTRPVGKITVAELIEALEGPIAITSCADVHHGSACHIEKLCPTRAGWSRVNLALKSTLDNIFLDELLMPVKNMKRVS